METRREDVPNWDSFNYINFIVAVEIEFGVKFKVADIESFPDVGAIVKETTKLRLRRALGLRALASDRRFDGPTLRRFFALANDR